MREANQIVRYGDGRIMRNTLDECARVLAECKDIIEGTGKGKEKASALLERIAALSDSVGNALNAPMPNPKNKDFYDNYNDAYNAYAHDMYVSRRRTTDAGFADWCFDKPIVDGVPITPEPIKVTKNKDRYETEDEAKAEWNRIARDADGNEETFINLAEAFNAWMYTELGKPFDHAPWRVRMARIESEAKAKAAADEAAQAAEKTEAEQTGEA